MAKRLSDYHLGREVTVDFMKVILQAFRLSASRRQNQVYFAIPPVSRTG